MKRLIKQQDDIFAMSNMVGRYIKLDGHLPFSFYFGSKEVFGKELYHGIRIKLCPNPSKYQPYNTSDLELHGDYKIHNDANIKSKDIEIARKFFKKYKVLFAGAWEGVILEENITSYLKNRSSLQDIIEESDFTDEQKELLKYVETIDEFESLVRQYNMFNMND